MPTPPPPPAPRERSSKILVPKILLLEKTWSGHIKLNYDPSEDLGWLGDPTSHPLVRPRAVVFWAGGAEKALFRRRAGRGGPAGEGRGEEGRRRRLEKEARAGKVRRGRAAACAGAGRAAGGGGRRRAAGGRQARRGGAEPGARSPGAAPPGRPRGAGDAGPHAPPLGSARRSRARSPRPAAAAPARSAAEERPEEPGARAPRPPDMVGHLHLQGMEESLKEQSREGLLDSPDSGLPPSPSPSPPFYALAPGILDARAGGAGPSEARAVSARLGAHGGPGGGGVAWGWGAGEGLRSLRPRPGASEAGAGLHPHTSPQPRRWPSDSHAPRWGRGHVGGGGPAWSRTRGPARPCGGLSARESSVSGDPAGAARLSEMLAEVGPSLGGLQPRARALRRWYPGPCGASVLAAFTVPRAADVKAFFFFPFLSFSFFFFF